MKDEEQARRRDVDRVDKWATYGAFHGRNAELAHMLLENAGYVIVRVDVPDTEPRAQRPWSTDVRAVQSARLARKMGRR